jgi:selenocysteine lyase/cysteine desulfurase
MSHRVFGGISDYLDPNGEKETNKSITNITNVTQKGNNNKNININKRIEILRNNIIGSFSRFAGPYGNKPVIYADWTASGRAVYQIESYLSKNVIPLYGNTHTTTSITGHQSTCFRHESRQILAEATNAKITGKASADVVLFTGNGTTAAIAKLITSLGLHIPIPIELRDDITLHPVVFTSRYYLFIFSSIYLSIYLLY